MSRQNLCIAPLIAKSHSLSCILWFAAICLAALGVLAWKSGSQSDFWLALLTVNAATICLFFEQMVELARETFVAAFIRAQAKKPPEELPPLHISGNWTVAFIESLVVISLMMLMTGIVEQNMMFRLALAIGALQLAISAIQRAILVLRNRKLLAKLQRGELEEDE
jgi:hypothetical protein